MKKIRSRQLLKTVCLGILGGLLIMGLAGCSVNKNSRAYLEGKAAELERVFPTENLEDLFEEFPGGFKLWGLYDIKDENEYSYLQDIKINGHSKNKKITGIVQNVKITAEPTYKEEVLKESEFEYKNGQFKFDNPEFKESDLVVDGFLVQYLTINKNVLSQSKLLSKSYSWETEDGVISYQLVDKALNQYLNEDSNAKVDIIIDIDYETIHEDGYAYGLMFRYGKDVKFTMGISGYKEIGENDEE